MGTTTIKGGTVILTRDAKFPQTVNANWGYSEVAIAKGTMKVNQAVKFEGAVIPFKFGTGSKAIDLTKTASDIIRRAALVVDGRTYQASKIDTNADKKGGSLVFDSEFHFTKGEKKVELLLSLANTEVKYQDGTKLDKIDFDNILNTTFQKGEYLNSEETSFVASHIVGSIRVAKVNVQEQKLGLKKVGPIEDVKIVAGNTDEKVVFSGEVMNASDRTLEVNQVELALAAADTDLAAGKKVGDFTVVLGDGTTSSSVALSIPTPKANTSIKIDSLTRTLEPGKSMPFEVRVVNDANLAAGNNYKLTVKVKGRLEGNDVDSAEINAAKVIVKGSADTAIIGNTANAAENKMILPGVRTEVANFNYNVKNDSVDLNKVEFDVAGFAANDIDSVDVCFDDLCPANTSTVAGGKLTVNFLNVVTLTDKNYKAKVFVTFNESAAGNGMTPANKAKFDFYKAVKAALANDGDATNNNTKEKAAAEAVANYAAEASAAVKAAVTAIVANDADATLKAAQDAVKNELNTLR